MLRMFPRSRVRLEMLAFPVRTSQKALMSEIKRRVKTLNLQDQMAGSYLKTVGKLESASSRKILEADDEGGT